MKTKLTPALATLLALQGTASAAPAFRIEHSVILTCPPELHYSDIRTLWLEVDQEVVRTVPREWLVP